MERLENNEVNTIDNPSDECSLDPLLSVSVSDAEAEDESPVIIK